MRIVRFFKDGKQGYGLLANDADITVRTEDEGFGPASFVEALAGGEAGLANFAVALQAGPSIPLDSVDLATPVPLTGKLICIGANFGKHAAEAESVFTPGKHATFFLRVADGVVSPGAPLIKPKLSNAFDYEGELAVIIGTAGRHISVENALDHVAGYSIFQDGSIRDYQLEAPQWTLGKNFHATASLGPAFISADELPAGAKGLRLQTRLNGELVQDASLSDMLVDVVAAITTLSSVMTLEPGDVIAMGTPAGVGFFRKPQLFMKDGDLCEVEIERIGVLRNRVIDEA
ncbi:FAA hydrolase family protein [Sphingomonas populi]|uniref:FAA hydrolase family protein n=1 Tax=Sphingomonas populi TaxID=2484750 RepID=A0A4Q6XHP4_9SPHN|nr:fumarylacetoacetate hydrolase family protein [Sphingomonas populi]RZF59133.1 FAA hydrolase family protein [Sphingomonas populi]